MPFKEEHEEVQQIQQNLINRIFFLSNRSLITGKQYKTYLFLFLWHYDSSAVPGIYMLSDVDTDGMESPCVSHGAAREQSGSILRTYLV